jgi:hypothetical protein
MNYLSTNKNELNSWLKLEIIQKGQDTDIVHDSGNKND